MEERERRFTPPEGLTPLLAQVRMFLQDELDDAHSEGFSLVRASLALAGAAGGQLPEKRLIPLAGGVEMIYYALTRQQKALQEEGATALFAILTQDMALARALDLYTSDGNNRVMRIVSQGAASLCECLMAERAGGDSRDVLPLLARFHGSCLQIGAAAAGVDPDRERAMGEALEEYFRVSFGGEEEPESSAWNQFQAFACDASPMSCLQTAWKL